MNWVQIHLALNHIPVIGVPLLMVLLLAGWCRGSSELIRVTLWFLLGLSVAAIAIKFTGDFAAEQSATRLADAQNLVIRHEEAGDQVSTAVFILGLLSAVALWLTRRGRLISKWMIALVILVGLITSLLYARSAHTGGKISHPELR